MVGALLTFALVVSVIHHHFYTQESQEEHNFNVLLLGGFNQENVPEFRLEMINLGYCPNFDENRIHIPQLPMLILNLTARYSYSDDCVKICGVMEENRRHQCWMLRNGTSWWEMDTVDSSIPETTRNEDDVAQNSCSHRHGETTTLLGQTLYMLGGKR